MTIVDREFPIERKIPMEIKEKARERMEVRIHAKETLEAIIAWIQTVQPSAWLPMGKDSPVSSDDVKTHYRDFIDKASRLIDKCWKPAELLVDDLTSFMEEVCAKPKNPPEGK
jgi:hypothetical protein